LTESNLIINNKVIRIDSKKIIQGDEKLNS
jgi:hypothetical protein